MIDRNYARIRRISSAAGGLLVLCAAAAIAQETPPLSLDSGLEHALRAELSIEHGLLAPAEPIRVRFTLVNTTDRTITFAPGPSIRDAGGITLPAEVIFGREAEPALFMEYESDRPAELRPLETAPSEQEGEPVEDPTDEEAREIALRLAPYASVGAEIDLRPLSRQFRYPGSYAIVWKPLGGKIAPAMVRFRLEPRKQAVLVTDYGKITFTLLYDHAPRNIENLLELARERFYDGLTFHRILPQFIIQGGSPNGQGSGMRPDGRTIKAEFSDHAFDAGTLAMARKPSDPDSASCQFFIVLARRDELDGQYTAVGAARDAESLRTLQQLGEQPTDENGRPLRPVVIRFFTLIDEPATAAERRLELSTP